MPKLIPFYPTYLIIFIYANLSIFFPTSTHFSSFPNLCPTPPIASNYAKLFQNIPSLCPTSPFMSDYCQFINFSSTFAKIPNFSSSFSHLCQNYPLLFNFAKFIRFCPRYATIIHLCPILPIYQILPCLCQMF
jgi:hypothetical protein